MERFQVYVRKSARIYRIQVTITYRSSQVMRFVIWGQKTRRYIKADKLLIRKTNQWKLGETNCKLDIRYSKENARIMREILWEVEAYLKGSSAKKIHPKNM